MESEQRKESWKRLAHLYRQVLGGSSPTVTRTPGQYSNQAGGALQVQATLGDPVPHTGNDGGGRVQYPGGIGSGVSGAEPQERQS